MPYELQSRLVIGVASSAVFDLQESDAVFKSQGEEQYRRFQEENLNEPLPKGIAFPFIKRLLALNVRWMAFIGQIRPLTSLTPGGSNRVRSQCRPRGEFCPPGSCGVLHGNTSTGSVPG